MANPLGKIVLVDKSGRQRLRRALVVLSAVLIGVLNSTSIAMAGQGSGNPVLVVEPVTISPTGVATITVRGYDYLVPPHAPGTSVFGGVYVLFGWVVDPNRFGPSLRNSNNNDGTFGVSYLYPGLGGDANIRDDGSGVIRLVSFTPGGESGGATDYHMDPEGNWVAEMKVYGPTFSGTDPRTGQSFDVDCRQVQCGVFTIGAHGKISATNEKFTPINFQVPATPTTSTTTPSTTSTTTVPATTTTLPGAATTTTPSASTTEAGGIVAPPGSGGAPTVPETSQPGSTSTVTTPVGTDDQPIAVDVVSTRSTGNPTPLYVGGGLLLVGSAVGLLIRKIKT